ncbi:hypothetical protein C8A01DRAFT_31718 [Parachaetomium inaequale]|uniref:Uncharacterized protein n=1 Tax=Parachaetomium inaequale TaxID=2588326 RepID=A0AAN6PN47_9PEZI|nr:hypothetical protein C8A01DRAFT_31718 [Parachaetomium inaequale]
MDKAAKTLAQVAAILMQIAAAGPGSKAIAVVSTTAGIQPVAAGVLEAANNVTQYASDNWNFLMSAAGIAGGALIAVLPQVITGPVLYLAGVGMKGIIAKSVAALVHSYIGNVVKESVFSILQSAGRGGWGAAVVNWLISLFGKLMAGAIAGGSLWIWLKAILFPDGEGNNSLRINF